MWRKSKYMIVAAVTVAILSACTSDKSIEEENSASETSTDFTIPVMFGDETKGEYILLGKEGKLAFQIGSRAENETVELLPIVANQPNKYMWYLWGDNVSGKSFKVVGTHGDTKQEKVLVDNLVLGSELNGSDAHTPSSMEFPAAGMWNLEAYVDGELFENIAVEVQ